MLKRKSNTLSILLLLAYATATVPVTVSAKDHKLLSPDKQIAVTIHTDGGISFSIDYQDGRLVEATSVAMELEGGDVLGAPPHIENVTEEKVNKKIEAPLSTKSSLIVDEYNLLSLQFREKFALEFRAYDHGFAYRFVTGINRDIVVRTEVLNLEFTSGSSIYFPEEETLVSHYERSYTYAAMEDIEDGKFCSLPYLAGSPDGVKVLFTESDLGDYPGMFMKKKGSTGLEALFPKYVLKTVPLPGREDRSELVEGEADYIARTAGKRTFPWRVFIIGQDKDLVESSLVYQLAGQSKLDDTGWIKPGQIAWDWYNANNVYGVDFVSGLDTKTYKYYIDFASDYGIEYVILDEGWSKSTTEITSSSDILDVEEIIRYGKEKGVGIILWVLWKPLERDIPGILRLYREWGASGVKVDFMQRADQYMVNYYYRVAREAAKLELLVDFHGAYKPTGLHREYPNVLTFEGVKGNEHNKWSKDITPDHNLTIPFIRMAAGPMDYTPGSMANAQEVNHHISFERPVGLGTRCHEIAKYVIFESPLQMLCDSPSRYMREPECTGFIVRIPQVWDETRVLEARVSDYLVIARRSGDDWYLAAMTDWTARDFEVKLDFISEGSYDLEVMQDGVNANRFAEDYKLIRSSISRNDVLNARLAGGGGWIAILKKR